MPTPPAHSRTVRIYTYKWMFPREEEWHYYCEYDFSTVGRITDDVIILGEAFDIVEPAVLALVAALESVPCVVSVSITPYSIEFEFDNDLLRMGEFHRRSYLLISRFLANQRFGEVRYTEAKPQRMVRTAGT